MNNYGWDTVSIVQNTYVNSRITNTWDKEMMRVDYHDADILHIECDFCPWEIIEGGGGNNINMKLPIQSGTYTYQQSSHDISGITLYIQCTLDFYTTPEQSVELRFCMRELVEDQFEASGDNTGKVYPIHVDDPLSKLSKYDEKILIDSICEYYIQNNDRINYVFARINYSAAQQVSWLIPYKNVYGCYEANQGCLAIMSVCSDKDISTLTRNIEIYTDYERGNGSYSISREILYENMVIPEQLNVLINNNRSNFQIVNNVITNKDQLHFHKVHNGAIDYYPNINSFRCEVIGDKMAVSYDGDCDLYAGINMTFHLELDVRPVLNEDTQAITFATTITRYDKDYDVPWYLAWMLGLAHLAAKVISDDIMDQMSKCFEQTLQGMQATPISWSCQSDKTRVVKAFFSWEFVLELQNL